MLRLCRRWLARWRIDAPTVVYFVTWRLADGQRPLTGAERTLVCETLHHGDGHAQRLLAFVVMDDHVHVLVEPKSVALERLTHSWKSFTAHQLQRLHRRQGTVWQHESFDRVVRCEEDLREKAEYIVANPWKRWPFLKAYPWVWEAGGQEPDRVDVQTQRGL